MIHLDSSFWKSRLLRSLHFYYINSLVLALPHKLLNIMARAARCNRNSSQTALKVPWVGLMEAVEVHFCIKALHAKCIVFWIICSFRYDWQLSSARYWRKINVGGASGLKTPEDEDIRNETCFKMHLATTVGGSYSVAGACIQAHAVSHSWSHLWSTQAPGPRSQSQRSTLIYANVDGAFIRPLLHTNN